MDDLVDSDVQEFALVDPGVVAEVIALVKKHWQHIDGGCYCGPYGQFTDIDDVVNGYFRHSHGSPQYLRKEEWAYWYHADQMLRLVSTWTDTSKSTEEYNDWYNTNRLTSVRTRDLPEGHPLRVGLMKRWDGTQPR